MWRLLAHPQKSHRFLSSRCQLLIRPINKANIPLLHFLALGYAKQIWEVNQRLPG